jgi:hypothetical protein
MPAWPGGFQLYADDMHPSQPEFVNKTLTVNVWGMDINLKPFTGPAQTRRIAPRAVELELPRQLAIGEVVGVGYLGKRSRFRVTQAFINGANTYRVTLEDTGTECMWTAEMAAPDVIAPRAERRRDPRLPIVGNAVLFNGQGVSSHAKLCDISRRGCYVEIYSPSPVGMEMRVLLTLDGNKHVDMTAVVRTAHPTIGMGMEILRFAAVEDEERFVHVLQSLEVPQNA